MFRFLKIEDEVEDGKDYRRGGGVGREGSKNKVR